MAIEWGSNALVIPQEDWPRVHEIRCMTAASWMECKRAFVDAGRDVDKAIAAIKEQYRSK